jgi:hypothetical protein
MTILIALAVAAVLIIAVTATMCFVVGYLRGYRSGVERGPHTPRHAVAEADPTVTRPDFAEALQSPGNTS